MEANPWKPTKRERAQVEVGRPQEVVGWCSKWGVTPERLKAVVAAAGPSAVSVAKAPGKAPWTIRPGTPWR